MYVSECQLPRAERRVCQCEGRLPTLPWNLTEKSEKLTDASAPVSTTWPPEAVMPIPTLMLPPLG